MKRMLYGSVIVALSGLGLVSCATQPSPQGGAPVEARTRQRPPPPPPEPVVAPQPPSVQVTPLARPDPILPEVGPVVPDDPYSSAPQAALQQPPEGNIPYPPARTYQQPESPPQLGAYPEEPSSPEATPVDAAMATNQGNQAVVALLDSAATHVNAGELDKAAASLERALRIEPRNAGIWHDLGQIRLHQGQYQQAESLATKSNSLSGGNEMLKARNWRLIANARRAVGDQMGADAAEAPALVSER